MLKDKTALLISGLTAFIFFIGGLTDSLYNPIVIGLLLTCFCLVIVNLILVKKEVDEDKPTKD